MKSPEPNAFFVYGTLKRNQERERMWPRQPHEVAAATAVGQLFDLGPYPAMARGDGVVGGEVWMFDPADMAAVLAVLDEIEWYNQDGDDLYVREIIACNLSGGRRIPAYAYFYADTSQLESAHRIRPDASGVEEWPGPTSASSS